MVILVRHPKVIGKDQPQLRMREGPNRGEEVLLIDFQQNGIDMFAEVPLAVRTGARQVKSAPDEPRPDIISDRSLNLRRETGFVLGEDVDAALGVISGPAFTDRGGKKDLLMMENGHLINPLASSRR